jgi:hypothetical protein
MSQFEINATMVDKYSVHIETPVQNSFTVTIDPPVQKTFTVTLGGIGTNSGAISNGQFLTRNSIASISALRAVADTSFGVSTVDPLNSLSLASLIGVSINAASNGQMVTVQQKGILQDPSWNWTPNQPIFVGSMGILTNTPPTSIATRQVGVALSATAILIDISDLILME